MRMQIDAQRPLPFDAPGLTSGAEFSPCRRYRYALWRQWDWQGYANQVMFIGLNPSTADETQDDPTIRRCLRFAKDWGFGGLLMLNAFAFRATDPKVMQRASDPVGPGNDEALAYRRSQVGLIVAAWGAHCPPERERAVCRVLGTTIHCLGRTKDGRPRHPLYLRADTKPEVFWEPEEETPAMMSRMIVCETCGNKRCPHATDPRLACTGSNEPGQPGSAY